MNIKGNQNWACLNKEEMEALELFENTDKLKKLKLLNGDLGRRRYWNM